MKWRLAAVLFVFTRFAFADQPIPVGSGRVELTIGSKPLEVFTYKPADYDAKAGPLVLVFHGVLRNADTYRDAGKPLADVSRGLVVAPRFTVDEFPTAKYQFGNLLTNGRANPPEQWTWSLVPKIAEAIRRRENRPDMPYDLIGHSGGGQFLARLAAFAKTDARRIVASNAGSHTFVNRDLPFPYGFGKLPPDLSGDDALKQFLAQPLTLQLGTADDHPDEYFDAKPDAMKQGGSRLERGRNAYKLAQSLAKEKSWPFHWTLVEAEGIEHDSTKMFAHPSAKKALGWDK
ncbi:MAG: hypothetical protein U0746_02635 [Gemmataceae bacterium]